MAENLSHGRPGHVRFMLAASFLTLLWVSMDAWPQSTDAPSPTGSAGSMVGGGIGTGVGNLTPVPGTLGTMLRIDAGAGAAGLGSFGVSPAMQRAGSTDVRSRSAPAGEASPKRRGAVVAPVENKGDPSVDADVAGVSRRVNMSLGRGGAGQSSAYEKSLRVDPQASSVRPVRFRVLDLDKKLIKARTADSKGDAGAVKQTLSEFFEAERGRAAGSFGTIAETAKSALPDPKQVGAEQALRKIVDLAKAAEPADAPMLYRYGLDIAHSQFGPAEAERRSHLIFQSAVRQAPDAISALARQALQDAGAQTLPERRMRKVFDALDFFNAHLALAGFPYIGNLQGLQDAVGHIALASKAHPGERFAAPEVSFEPTHGPSGTPMLKAVVSAAPALSEIETVPARVVGSFALKPAAIVGMEMGDAAPFASRFRLSPDGWAGFKAAFSAHRAAGDSTLRSLWMSLRYSAGHEASGLWARLRRMMRSLLAKMGLGGADEWQAPRIAAAGQSVPLESLLTALDGIGASKTASSRDHASPRNDWFHVILTPAGSRAEVAADLREPEEGGAVRMRFEAWDEGLSGRAKEYFVAGLFYNLGFSIGAGDSGVEVVMDKDHEALPLDETARRTAVALRALQTMSRFDAALPALLQGSVNSNENSRRIDDWVAVVMAEAHISARTVPAGSPSSGEMGSDSGLGGAASRAPMEIDGIAVSLGSGEKGAAKVTYDKYKAQKGGDIFVTSFADDPQTLEAVRRARAVVYTQGGRSSRTALSALAAKVPALWLAPQVAEWTSDRGLKLKSGARVTILREGTWVELDPASGKLIVPAARP